MSQILAIGISEGFGLFFTIIGSIFIVLAFLPQFLFVHKTRNTVAFNVPMFSLYAAVSYFFLFSSFFTLVSVYNDSKWLSIVQFSCMCLLNLSLCLASVYMLYVKAFNMEEAKKLSISELDYYNNYIVNKK